MAGMGHTQTSTPRVGMAGTSVQGEFSSTGVQCIASRVCHQLKSSGVLQTLQLDLCQHQCLLWTPLPCSSVSTHRVVKQRFFGVVQLMCRAIANVQQRVMGHKLTVQLICYSHVLCLLGWTGHGVLAQVLISGLFQAHLLGVRELNC